MNEYIAYCALDCEACEARLATLNTCEKLSMITGNNADALRRMKEQQHGK